MTLDSIHMSMSAYQVVHQFLQENPIPSLLSPAPVSSTPESTSTMFSASASASSSSSVSAASTSAASSSSSQTITQTQQSSERDAKLSEQLYVRWTVRIAAFSACTSFVSHSIVVIFRDVSPKKQDYFRILCERVCIFFSYDVQKQKSSKAFEDMVCSSDQLSLLWVFTSGAVVFSLSSCFV